MNSIRVPKICLAITGNDIKAIKQVEPLVDLFEVRIDLIGDAWQELVKHLKKPWIACNRCAERSCIGSDSGRCNGDRGVLQNASHGVPKLHVPDLMGQHGKHFLPRICRQNHFIGDHNGPAGKSESVIMEAQVWSTS